MLCSVNVMYLYLKVFTLLELCVSSLRRGQARLIVMLTDDPRREFGPCICTYLYLGTRHLAQTRRTVGVPVSHVLQHVSVTYLARYASQHWCSAHVGWLGISRVPGCLIRLRETRRLPCAAGTTCPRARAHPCKSYRSSQRRRMITTTVVQIGKHRLLY